MPELQALAEGLDRVLAGRRVESATLWQPATLKNTEPALSDLAGKRVKRVWRRGKLVGLDAGGLSIVIHLMQAGRLGLTRRKTGRPGKTACLDVNIEGGLMLRLRELSTERRAKAHVLETKTAGEHPLLATLGPEPVGLVPGGWRAGLGSPAARLHTALRDGHRVAGIGRCYANEIMWAAQMAPYARTDKLPKEAWSRLAAAADAVLGQALERARERIATDLPNKEKRVTAVHGHYREPCLRCGTTLERVSFVDYELVYCAPCQTDGKVYADRRMSRLLK